MRWHTYFDGKLDELVAHVCDAHRAEVLELPCGQCRSDDILDCPHVQHRRCDCGDWPDCDLCAEERALTG